MRRILILVLISVFHLNAKAQSLNPGDYVFPVRDVARLYSANFGEMRPGHFHGGVDFKTDGVEGKPLVAVADGYVSRVNITAYGYGRAVYLTLDNGTTAVYGHLQRFRDDVERHVRDERYRRRSNSVDLRFGPETWPVKQGEVIGFSGNSGSSMGPHLHFELRDTPTQRLHNIVRAGIVRPDDDLPPQIMRIHYIEVDTLQGVPVHARPESYAVQRSADNSYRLAQKELLATGRKGYFVVEASDRRNGVNNTFGLWRAALSVDERPCFEYRMDGFEQEFSRCCDAASYYPLQLTSRNEAIRLAQLSEAPACFYPVVEERGVVRTAPGERRRIRIETEDDCGNCSHLEFDIVGRAGSFRAEADTTAVALRPDALATLRLDQELIVRIPAGALYEPLFCRPERCEAPRSDSTAVVLSSAYRILAPTTPLREAMTVSIRAFVPEQLQSRTLLAARTRKGGIACIGGKYADGAITATTRTVGDFFVAADTLPPRIRPLFTEGADLTHAADLRFRIGDNLSGIASCELLVDGQWVPCDRLPIQGVLLYKFDTPGAHKRHRAQLTLTDACGNISRWEGTFSR